MLHRNLILTLLLTIGLCASACQPITRPAAKPQPPQGLRPDAPAYAKHGPYAVGAREFVVEQGNPPLTITVWYPALNVRQAKEEIVYQISATNSRYPGRSVHGQALQDAAADTGHGPYPVVIFSPGLAAFRQANSYLYEHLASYGFVVMAGDPRGETRKEFWAGAATRPLDTRLILHYADQLTAAGGALAGLLDMAQIATTGHSSGGWSALVGGGAQMDLSWCAANPALAQADLSNCTQFVPHQQQIAAMVGLQAVPTGLWPALNDPRVKAVIALAPDGDIWGANYEGVAALKVPTLIMAGSKDRVNVPEQAAYPIYEHLGSAQKRLIVFENADHTIFFSQCRDLPWLREVNYWLCSDSVWEMDRAHDLINHFATAFLLAQLKGDAAAAKVLLPAQVSFPGIQYKTTATP